MKKILTVIMIMLLPVISVSAQSYLPGKVAFTPVFGNYTGFSDEVCSIMEQRLTQIVVSNGLGSYSNQYVITHEGRCNCFNSIERSLFFGLRFLP